MFLARQNLSSCCYVNDFKAKFPGLIEASHWLSLQNLGIWPYLEIVSCIIEVIKDGDNIQPGLEWVLNPECSYEGHRKGTKRFRERDVTSETEVGVTLPQAEEARSWKEERSCPRVLAGTCGRHLASRRPATELWENQFLFFKVTQFFTNMEALGI